MKTLAERAAYLLGLIGNSTKDLARIAGVKPPSVSQWVSGQTKSIQIEPATRLAKHFGMNPLWVSKGIPPMRELSPSSDTQTESTAAEFARVTTSGSAMLLDFPSVSHQSLRAKDTYFIPQYGTGGSMGRGLLLPDQPGVIENWSVSREWLNKNVRNITKPGNLCIVTGFGPSMQPMFNPGDPLLVDTGVKSVIADGIYFFRVGDEGFIKQLQKIPTSAGIKYVAKSKNKDFDTFEITSDMDFEVLGKVVRVWCGTDF